MGNSGSFLIIVSPGPDRASALPNFSVNIVERSKAANGRGAIADEWYKKAINV